VGNEEKIGGLRQGVCSSPSIPGSPRESALSAKPNAGKPSVARIKPPRLRSPPWLQNGNRTSNRQKIAGEAEISRQALKKHLDAGRIEPDFITNGRKLFRAVELCEYHEGVRPVVCQVTVPGGNRTHITVTRYARMRARWETGFPCLANIFRLPLRNVPD